MNNKLNIQDISNCLTFLNRVDIKGNEAMPMTDLQMKLQMMRQEMVDAETAAQKQAMQPPPPPPAPPSGDDGDGAKTEH